MPKASIVLCSYKRPQALQKCLESLYKQSYKDFEIILHEEEAPLVELKDQGWREAKGKVIVWIDDDVVCHCDWLAKIMGYLDSDAEILTDIVGVTGPSYVPPMYLNNRDIFKENIWQKLYYFFFLGKYAFYPGLITPWGASTVGASFDTFLSRQAHWVDFLEPCHFAIKKWALQLVSGFDLGYTGVAEWCDVDLCFRLKAFGKLLYSPDIKVYHYPEQGDSVYQKRLDTKSRYQNYLKFSKRFIKPSIKYFLYRQLLKRYFQIKQKGWI